jgi:predicted ATPase
MVGFSRLAVEGYRRLKSVLVPLRPLNVLIGANGVGKSSCLDVFDLLAASANGNLAATITAMGGMNSLVTADGNTDAIMFQLRTDHDGVSGPAYDLRLNTQGYGYAIANEELNEVRNPPLENATSYLVAVDQKVEYWDGQRLITPNWDYKPQETALSQVPKMYGSAERFRRLVADVSEVYHGLDVSLRAPVRLPQPLSPTQMPGSNGEDLVSCLYTIRETEHERYEAIEDALRAAFPTFERLDIPLVAAGRGTIAWQESGFTRQFYANEMSEGTLRFLWLATLLQSPGLPQVTLIDEPEVSLHPEMLRLLAELMREASERTQLVVATHSDRFVRFLRPHEILVCDRDEDTSGMTVQWADEVPNLAAWMEDYTLDQLWSKGILGGRS